MPRVVGSLEQSNVPFPGCVLGILEEVIALPV